MSGNFKCAASRTDVLIRLLFSLLFIAALELCRGLVILVCLAQYAIILATKRHSEHLRRFSNALCLYVYRLARYLTLNDNAKPFPFAALPTDIEPCEDPISFE